MLEGRPSVEVLTRAQCLEVMLSSELGRLAVVEAGQPDIFPVNFVLEGENVVFRSAPGQKLTHASLDQVAFEVDVVRPEDVASVVVKGTAREITDAVDTASERERELAIPSWWPGERSHWVRIVPHEITGRRLSRS